MRPLIIQRFGCGLEEGLKNRNHFELLKFMKLDADNLLLCFKTIIIASSLIYLLIKNQYR